MENGEIKLVLMEYLLCESYCTKLLVCFVMNFKILFWVYCFYFYIVDEENKVRVG